MRNTIDFLLTCLDMEAFLGKDKTRYFSTMLDFFQGKPWPLDPNPAPGWENPYKDILNKTLEHSGLNDTWVDNHGNEFYIEPTHLMD